MHRTGSSGWPLMIAAAAILMITMGVRQSLGLFVSPLNTATGLGVVAISFALAVAQFVWGASQPVFGAVADRYGAGRVIMLGGVLLAAGMAAAPFMQTTLGLTLTLGVLAAAGAGAGSFALLIGVASQHLPAERRAFAAGFINAGGSFGQFVFAPIAQVLISGVGWVFAMLALAASALATLPLVRMLERRPDAAGVQSGASAAAVPHETLGAQLRRALADRSYLCLHAGFFTCGFHIAFLVTHLPGEVQLCGLPASVSAVSLALIGLFNIGGSLAAGSLSQRYRMKYVLFWMYASRAVAIAIYLIAPKTASTFYVFGAVLGFTWLATVPPTAGLVGKLFGTRYLSTLFGLTLLSHQIGGFLGAWLGGIAIAQQGSYAAMWYADIALAVAAALVNLPIREAAPALRTARA